MIHYNLYALVLLSIFYYRDKTRVQIFLFHKQNNELYVYCMILIHITYVVTRYIHVQIQIL